MASRWLILAAAACLSCGQGLDASGDLGTSQLALRGGEAETAYEAVGYIESGGGICTGTLIAPNAVLTAAHCVTNASEFTFHLGTYGAPSGSYPVSQVIIHPEHSTDPSNPNFYVNDIAILGLSSPVEDIAPAQLGDIEEVL